MNDIQVPAPPRAKSSTEVSGVPVTVFTGFLGAGKTTVIAHLLEQISSKEKIVFIKNEQGSVDLDSQLIAATGTKSQELLNGCVCCTLMGPLLETIDSMIDQYTPTRILLESSGTAEPINLAVTLNGQSGIYRDGVICVIDALNFSQTHDLNDHYQLQAKLTDLIIINKGDDLSTTQQNELLSSIKQINDYSPIIWSEKGRVNADVVFGLSSVIDYAAEQHHHQPHNIPDTIVARYPTTANLEILLKQLKLLPSSVIRVKGIVRTPEPIAINQAFKRISTQPIEVSIQDSFLYFIGKNLKQDESHILELINQAFLGSQ